MTYRNWKTPQVQTSPAITGIELVRVGIELRSSVPPE
jgi:hypothetical protein